MKIKNLFFILLSLNFFISSCGGDKNEETQKTKSDFVLDNDYYEFQGLSLKQYQIPIMIMLPDETANIGASTKPEVIHTDGDFKWELFVGANFHLLIDDWGDYTDMVASRKKELQELDFYKINYLIDEKDFILYEQELMPKGVDKGAKGVGVPHKSYHVYAEKVIDGVTYVFKSSDEGAEKLIIELMAKSIKSIKVLKNSKV